MEQLWQDVRLACRGFVRQPGFSTVAVVILALGIGANTAIFTLVDAVARRPLPVSHAGELYRLGETNACCVNTGLQRSFSLFSYPLYRHFREQLPEFETLAAFQVQALPLSVRRSGSSAPAEPLVGEFVSANYFSTLGVPIEAGRGLVDADDAAGAPPVAVLSYRAWRDRYGLDPAVVGGSLTISGRPVTVAGIAGAEFFGETLRPNPPDVWLPLGVEPLIRGVTVGVVGSSGAATSLVSRPDQHWLYAIGRLKPGVSVTAVQDQASAVLRAWLPATLELSADDRARVPDQHVVITPAATGISTLRTRYADGLRVLGIVSALVLLIACANLANLLLARTQPFPFAMRAALGASRGRLIQQTIVAGVMLAATGGLAGLAVAGLGTRAMIAMAFRGASFVPIDTAPSWSILAFATIVSLATGIVFSAIPAAVMARANPMDVLRGAGRSGADRSMLPRQGLVVLQVAASLVLLVGAGLLTVSLSRLEHQSFGFETDGRLMVKVDPSFSGYTIERLPDLYERLKTNLARLPGVREVALSQYSPMEGFNWSGYISVEGRPVDSAKHIYSSYLRVGPRYFDAVGTRLLRGRTIDERDRPGTRPVAVVNETFVRLYFPDVDPIGRHVGIGEEAGHAFDWEIIGVVEDAKYLDADQPAYQTFFVPLLQTVTYAVEGLRSMQARSLFIRDIVLHVDNGRSGLDADVRRAVAAVDPNLTVTAIMSFEEQLGRNFNQQRLIARLTALYGQLALLLAAVGLYGVTSQYVARRTAEIGVRMALGADRRRVLAMVLGRALAQAAAGLAIGIPAALLVGRFLSTMLYQVGGQDPFVLSGAVLVLVVSALIAAVLPARRAASLDPVKALRQS